MRAPCRSTWCLAFALLAACGPKVRPPEITPSRTVAPVGAPTQARAAYLAGRLALERGDLVWAEAALDEAYAFDPAAPAIALARGQARLQAGDGHGAGQQWAIAAAAGPPLPAAALARMVAWHGLQQPASAAAVALAVATCAASRPDAATAVVVALASVGVETATARDHLERCRPESPERPAG